MNNYDFKVGDRVKHTRFGDGKVIGFYRYSVGVEFDIYNDEMHDLGGACPSGLGWWCEPNNLILVETPKSMLKSGDRLMATCESEGE